MTNSTSSTHILLGVTGSIAAYRAADLIGELRRAGKEVRCVMTAAAQRFITPLTLETVSGQPVYTELFPEQIDPAVRAVHISLNEWADAVVIAPASASCIGKIAQGICDDLLSCVVVSSKAPVLLAPAMNEAMYLNAAVQRNIATLQEQGVSFVGPVSGRLACGAEGMGHIASVDEIMTKIRSLLS